MNIHTIACLLLCCTSCALPDTYGVTGGYGQGTIDGRSDYDTDQWIGMLTVGWSPGDASRHREQLEATRRLEIATVTGQVQPIVVETGDNAQRDGSTIESMLPSIPQTEEESWNLLRWAGAILILAVAAGVLHLAGFKLPFFKKDSEPPTKETTT